MPLAVTSQEEDTGLTEIEDEEVPLAAVGEQEQPATHGFWWWILLIIAAVTGKTAYDKKNKKGIFAEKEGTNHSGGSNR